MVDAVALVSEVSGREERGMVSLLVPGVEESGQEDRWRRLISGADVVSCAKKATQPVSVV